MAKKGEIIKPLIERFLSFVDKKSETECWNWTGAKALGYGILAKGWKQTPYKACRLSYELFVGPIPNGLYIRHKCDNPACVNPNHLEPGTQKQNMQDASKRGRLNPISLKNLRPGAKGILGAGNARN